MRVHQKIIIIEVDISFRNQYFTCLCNISLMSTCNFKSQITKCFVFLPRFSREMRQIAGGSKVGLRRFLAQYPYLFHIDNDLVSISTLASSIDPASTSPGGRDYSYEAMVYFRDKLRQYGEGIEVPIKSLLGHRSQVRLILHLYIILIDYYYC